MDRMQAEGTMRNTHPSAAGSCDTSRGTSVSSCGMVRLVIIHFLPLSSRMPPGPDVYVQQPCWMFGDRGSIS